MLLSTLVFAQPATVWPGLVRLIYRVQAQTNAQPNQNWGIWIILLLVLIVLLWWLLQGEARARSTRANVVVVSPPATPNAPVRVTVTPVAPVAVADDLTKIEGIGPKIKGVLQEAGIKTFADLAQADIAHLRQILDAAGLRVNDPTTWPEQAALAAAGQWTALQQLQANLDAGRRG